MATLDWIFIAVLLLSLIVGAWRGLVVEVFSLAGWVAAFFAARWLAPEVALRLPMDGASEVLRYGTAFVLVFVVVAFAASIATWLVGKVFQAAGLRTADRTLGAVFGLMRGVLVLLAAAVLVPMTAMKTETWWTESAGAAWATATVKGLRPILPPEFLKYIP